MNKFTATGRVRNRGKNITHTQTSNNTIIYAACQVPSQACIILNVAQIKVVTTNRKAYHNYLIGDSIEAGLALTGSEIKSIRTGAIDLGDAYVRREGNELLLWNAHIARYEAGSYMSHEPLRTRKLLLHRKEIRDFTGKMAEKGLAMVPTRMYLKGNLAKIEIALAKGKKLHDKRETIIRRETDREMARAMKKRRE